MDWDTLLSMTQMSQTFAQDMTRRRYFKGAAPFDGGLPWDRLSVDVLRHVRAADYSPFPSPWGSPKTVLGGHAFGVVKAQATGERAGQDPGTVGEIGPDGVNVATLDEWVRVTKVQDASGQILQAEEVFRPGQKLGLAPAGS